MGGMTSSSEQEVKVFLLDSLPAALACGNARKVSFQTLIMIADRPGAHGLGQFLDDAGRRRMQTRISPVGMHQNIGVDGDQIAK